MLKKLTLAAVVALSVSGTAYAGCSGSGSYQHCYDAQSGNSYNIQRHGNTTTMRGYNSGTGSTWSQTSRTYGNTTRHHGISADGDSWSSTTRDYGGGNSYGSGSGLSGQGISNCGIAGCD